MSELDQIYKKQILEEAKHPFHFEKREGSLEQIRAYNPICGDRFDLYLSENDLHFHGFGCTISKASTSFMLRRLEGKTDQEQLEIINEFLKSIDQNLSINDPMLKVFENKETFRGRLDCIILPWKALKEKLEE